MSAKTCYLDNQKDGVQAQRGRQVDQGGDPGPEKGKAEGTMTQGPDNKAETKDFRPPETSPKRPKCEAMHDGAPGRKTSQIETSSSFTAGGVAVPSASPPDEMPAREV